MDHFLTLVTMIFLHLFADYQLQGILSKMKQREWWNKQIEDCGNTIYKNDYKAALIAHSFEWAFVMSLPILHEIYFSCFGFYYYSVVSVGTYLVLLALNTFVHYKVDDAKANRMTINLVKDQTIHLAQVIITWFAYTGLTWKFFFS